MILRFSFAITEEFHARDSEEFNRFLKQHWGRHKLLSKGQYDLSSALDEFNDQHQLLKVDGNGNAVYEHGSTSNGSLEIEYTIRIPEDEPSLVLAVAEVENIGYRYIYEVIVYRERSG